MGRIYGYARVSSGTGTQTTDGQVEKLKESGCSKVFYETVSSRVPAEQRPQLQAVLTVLEPSDELRVVSLSRLGRTQVEIINCLHDLQTRQIFVKTLDGLIDTKALGKMSPLVIGLLTGLNQIERYLIRERTLESVNYRRKHNMDLGGRRPLEEVKKNNIIKLRHEGNSLRQIVKLTGVSLSAVQRVCKNKENIAA